MRRSGIFAASATCIATCTATLLATSCFELTPRPDAGVGDPPQGIIAGQISLAGTTNGFSVRQQNGIVQTRVDVALARDDGDVAPARPPSRDINVVGRGAAPPAPRSKSRMQLEWKAGDALIAFERGKFDDVTLATAARKMLHRAGMDNVTAEVVRCTASIYCKVQLFDESGALLDKDRTEEVIDAMHKYRIDGVNVVAKNAKKYGFRAPNDDFFGFQWHYDFIHMQAAWDIQIGDPNLVIAVVDSGVIQAHPDLSAKLARDPVNGVQIVGADLISDLGTEIDAEDGRDTNPEDPGDGLFGAQGSSYHGTHIAGTIGAETDNAEGVAGINWNAQIVPVRVLGAQLSGFDDDIADGLYWAVGDNEVVGVPLNVKPAKVVNLSLGGPADEQVQQFWDTIINDILVDPNGRYPQEPILIAACGNSDEPADAITPANTAGMIAVAAHNISGLRASYSNYGGVVDIIAPGGEGNTDLNGDTQPDSILSLVNNDYDWREGTSMAAPHVTGVVGLLLAQNNTLNQGQVEALLKNGADPRGQCSEGCGSGYLDAVNSLLLAGGEIQLTPFLATDVTQVFFPEGVQTRVVQVLNLGNAPFTFNAQIEGAQDDLFSVSPATGTVDAATNPNNNRVALTITLNRGTFLTGAANLRIVGQGDAAGQERIIDLAFNVDPTRQPRQIQIVELGAFIEGEQGELIRKGSAFAEAANDFVYEIRDLPAGEYIVHATGDDNHDGVFDRQRESIGAYPNASEPGVVVVGDDQRVDGINFNLESGFIVDAVVGDVGAPCDEDIDCTFAPDAECITSFSAGYCSRFCQDDGFCGGLGECSPGLQCTDDNGVPFECAVCFKQCVSDQQCRFGDGYVCDPFGTCTPDGFN